jgi:hypothetical protein
MDGDCLDWALADFSG